MTRAASAPNLRVTSRGAMIDARTGQVLNANPPRVLVDVYWNGTVPSVNASFGLSGIVDDGAGTITLVFQPGFTTTNYVASAMACGVGNTYAHILVKDAASCQVEVCNENGTAVDPSGLMFMAFGD